MIRESAVVSTGFDEKLTGAPEGPERAPRLRAMQGSAIHDRLNRFAA